MNIRVDKRSCREALLCADIAASREARAELSAEDLAQAGKRQPLGLQRRTVPRGADIGIGKILHLGKQPVNIRFSVYHDVVRLRQRRHLNDEAAGAAHVPEMMRHELRHTVLGAAGAAAR